MNAGVAHVPPDPAVSIIIAVYNRLPLLREAIASVMAQTFQDWELLIADDGSDEVTSEYLRSLHEPPKVRLIELAHTGKPSVARNAALRIAKGRYVSFMDSDDQWTPRKLEIQLNSLQSRPECAWSHTAFVLANLAGGTIREMPAAGGWLLERLIRGEIVIALPSVLSSRALLERVGGFDEDLVMCEDYDLWMRMAAMSRVDAIDRPLTIVRRHAEHYGNPIVALRDVIHVLGKLLSADAARPYRPIARQKRAKYRALLARRYVIAGDRRSAFDILRSTAASSWRYGQWWYVAFQAVLAAAAPAGAIRTYRRLRRAASRGAQGR